MSKTFDQKLFYNTVLSQSFSFQGNHLLAGNIYGDVSIYNLSKIFGPHQTEKDDLQGPNYRFSPYPEQHIQSMIAVKNFLVIGTQGEISGWDWDNIISNKASKTKASWIVQIPTNRDTFEKPDVNYMKYSEADHLLYAGCGDNNVYVINLEDGRIVRKLEGHTDYIHCLSQITNQLASASEDGTVRLWDLRKNTNTNVLTPHMVDRVARPKLGKWIGAVDFTEDWLLCGGGPCLGLWHVRTMELITVFDLNDKGIHEAHIHEERLIAGGASPHVYHLAYQGDILAQVSTSSNTVYSIVYQETPYKVLSIAGSSNCLDICTNLNYQEFALKFA